MKPRWWWSPPLCLAKLVVVIRHNSMAAISWTSRDHVHFLNMNFSKWRKIISDESLISMNLTILISDQPLTRNSRQLHPPAAFQTQPEHCPRKDGRRPALYKPTAFEIEKMRCLARRPPGANRTPWRAMKSADSLVNPAWSWLINWSRMATAFTI